MSQARFDRAALKLGATPVLVRDNGWREYVGTAGFGNIVQEYPDLVPPRSEFRPAEEALHPETLASAEGVPVTDEHPDPDRTPAGLLIPETTRDHLSGAVLKAWAEGEKFRVRLIVYDPALQREIEEGTVDLSLGYSQDSDPTPGEYQGQRYDAIQRKVKINHLAVVRHARAIRPDGERARLDNQASLPAFQELHPLPYPSVAGPNMDEQNLPRTDAPALSEADMALVDQMSGPAKKMIMDAMAIKPEAEDAEEDAAEVESDVEQDKAMIAPLEDRIAALEDLIKGMKDAMPKDAKTPAARADAHPIFDMKTVLDRAEKAAVDRFNVTASFVDSVRVDGHKVVTATDAAAVMLTVIKDNLPGLYDMAKKDADEVRLDSLTRVYKEAERIRTEKLVQSQADALFPSARMDAHNNTFEVGDFDVV